MLKEEMIDSIISRIKKILQGYTIKELRQYQAELKNSEISY